MGRHSSEDSTAPTVLSSCGLRFESQAPFSIYCQIGNYKCFCIIYRFKRGILGLFYVYFRSFQTNNNFFTINWCEKYPSSIRCWDSNSWPSHYESSPLTTRPGSRPIVHYNWYCRKDENKQKEAGFGRFLKNSVSRKFWRNRLQLNFNLSWPNRKRPTPSLSTLTSISR